MITQITKENSASYKQLFEDASKMLYNKGVFTDADKVITSLPEYFMYIKTLLNCDITDTQHKKKFTRLPLDEDFFEINANTREIKIPKLFANGVSVQGDVISEIVYFKINRYFDAIDLDTMSVQVEWKTADETGVSPAWLVDVETFPEYLVFGWPIDEKLTAQAGQVEFAVRFYSIESGSNDTLSYSFSTVPAKIKILPALQTEGIIFAKDADIDKLKSLIERRTQAGRVNSVKYPEKPIFIYPNKDMDKDLGDDSTIKLYALAYTTDPIEVTYDWDDDNSEEPGYLESTNTEFVAVETLANFFGVTQQEFLEKIDESRFTVEKDGETISKIKCAVYTASKAAIYSAAAFGTVSLGEDITQKLQAITNCSYSFNIPKPKTPIVILNQNSSFVSQEITASAEINTEIEGITTAFGRWVKDGQFVSEDYTEANNEIFSYTPMAEGKYQVQVKKRRNNVDSENVLSAEECLVTYKLASPTESTITVDKPEAFIENHYSISSTTGTTLTANVRWPGNKQGAISETETVEIDTTLAPISTSYVWKRKKSNEAEYSILPAQTNVINPNDYKIHESGIYQCEITCQRNNSTVTVATPEITIAVI